MEKNLKDWRVLEFYVPIEEKFSKDGDDFLIKGVAINETTTLNNVKYVAEELQKAAPSFRNVPILLDHRNEVKNIVGRTTEKVDWNSTFNRIDFEAKIMDNDIKEMIKDGRIGSVSIGAKVDDLLEEEDGSMKAIGLQGMEISLVAVPGDAHANLAQALHKNFLLKEMALKSEEKLNVKEDLTMTDEEQAKEEVVKEETTDKAEEVPAEEVPAEAPAEEAPKEEPAEVAAEEKATNITVNVDNKEIAEMKKQISELKTLLVEKKKLTEQAEEDETKGEVSDGVQENINKINGLIVEKSKAGYAMYRDYSQDSTTDSKLKKLVR